MKRLIISLILISSYTYNSEKFDDKDLALFRKDFFHDRMSNGEIFVALETFLHNKKLVKKKSEESIKAEQDTSEEWHKLRGLFD